MNNPEDYAEHSFHSMLEHPLVKKKRLATRRGLLLGGLLLLLIVGGLSISISPLIKLVSPHPLQKWLYHSKDLVPVAPTIVENSIYLVSENEVTSMLTVVDAYSGQEKWKYQSNGLILFSPLVTNNLVYVISNKSITKSSTLNAIDVNSGQLKWSFTLDATVATLSPPIMVGKDICIFTGNGILYSLDSIYGKMRWSQHLGYNAVYSLTVVNGTVYAVSMDRVSQAGVLSAVDEASGHIEWSYHADQSSMIMFQPALADGMISIVLNDFATQESRVTTIDALSGALKWSVSIGSTLSVVSSFKIVENMLYVAATFLNEQQNRSLTVLDAKSGKQLWVKQGLDGGLSIEGKIVYAYTNTHELLCLDRVSGYQIWSSHKGLFSSGSISSVYLTDGSSESVK